MVLLLLYSIICIVTLRLYFTNLGKPFFFQLRTRKTVNYLKSSSRVSDINGLVTKSEFADAIYNAMRKITSDKSLLNKLRLNYRAFVKIKYEREVYWCLLLKEYESIINKNLR